MTPSNMLRQMLRADHDLADPGNGGIIWITKDLQYVSLSNGTAGSETRTLKGPVGKGLKTHLGCILCAAGSVVVTVKNSADSGSVTVTFTSAGQWIDLESKELTAGVFTWHATAVYGCSTTLQSAQNWSAAVAAGSITELVAGSITVSSNLLVAAGSITQLVVASTASLRSILATGLTAGTGSFTSNLTAGLMSATSLSAASVYATALTVGTAGVSSNLTAVNLTANTIVASQMNLTSATIASANVSSNLSVASALFTYLSGASASVSSNLQAASILASNISAGTGLSAASILASAVSVGTGGMTASTGPMVQGVTTAVFGGSAASLGSTIPNLPIVMISITNSAGFVKLPVAAVGLCVNIVNIGASTGLLVNNNLTNSVGGLTTGLAIGASNAANGAHNLVCDGTQWWKRNL